VALSSWLDSKGPVVDELVAGASALGLAIDASQTELLARYARLLLRWNSVHNLTAIRSPAEVLTHHLLDSLAIIPPLDGIFGEKRISCLDVGAGGGLPGIPMAVTKPGWRVTLLDKVEKKVAFLRQAKLELGLRNVECAHGRAEEFKGGPFDLIVSRAFASLPEFVRVSERMLAANGWWAAMKGVHPEDEIHALAKACPSVRVVDIVKLDVPGLNAERHLILMQAA
jgi:16S rRNA (guanine527-N7)-methyltransferase